MLLHIFVLYQYTSDTKYLKLLFNINLYNINKLIFITHKFKFTNKFIY